MRLKKRILACLAAVAALLGAAGNANAQDVALKTNLVNDGLLSPNAAIEVGVAPKWTIELLGEVNYWNKTYGAIMKHAFVQPEARYWFCQRFAGHFVGIHALGGTYNVGDMDIDMKFLGTDFRKLKDSRYQGWFAGAGIAYGYAWPVHKHWNIEGEVGIGWTYTRYDRYPCTVCGTKIEDNRPHNYFGLTKLAISIVYLF